MSSMLLPMGTNSIESHIYAFNSDLAAVTKKPDTLAGSGTCAYNSTPTGTTPALLGMTLINNLAMGQYTLMLRMKSANVALTTNAIQIDVQKNIAETFSNIASFNLKASDFVTTDYKNFYFNFEYKQAKATRNELKVNITLLQQASAYEVDLDSIVIMPSVVGVFPV